MPSAETPIFKLAGFEFGHRQGPIRSMEWDPIEHQVRSQDVTLHDHLIPGRDEAMPPEWRFRFRTLAPAGESAALAQVARLVGVWRPNLAPGEVSTLQYKVAGRWRRVYGRPRLVRQPTPSILVAGGRADIEARFQTTDPLHYDDVEQAITLPIAPSGGAGLMFPVTPPFRWVTSGEATNRTIVVGGDAPAPVRVTFWGPITDPWVKVGSVRVGLVGTINYDQAVTVDARLRTAVWSAGRSGSAAALLEPRASLAAMTLTPGTRGIQFGGLDATGTARVTVAWRNTWRGL